MDPWWTEQQAGMIGGLLGAGIGVFFGGIGGGLGGPLAAAGRAKAFVLGIFGAGIAIGAVLVITGLVALVLGQPWHVWLWLIMPGAVCAVVCGSLFPIVRMRYRQHEERVLAAEEFRRG